MQETHEEVRKDRTASNRNAKMTKSNHDGTSAAGFPYALHAEAKAVLRASDAKARALQTRNRFSNVHSQVRHIVAFAKDANSIDDPINHLIHYSRAITATMLVWVGLAMWPFFEPDIQTLRCICAAIQHSAACSLLHRSP